MDHRNEHSYLIPLIKFSNLSGFYLVTKDFLLSNRTLIPSRTLNFFLRNFSPGHLYDQTGNSIPNSTAFKAHTGEDI